MLPKVRSACEECHERKIRCLIPSHGGSCQACITSQRQCYFLPRQRAGRPRRGSRPFSSLSSSRHTTPALIQTPHSKNDADDVSPDSVWPACATLPSFIDNALTTSDVLSLPPDLPNFASTPLSNSPMLPDYLVIKDSIDFCPQPHHSGDSESGSAGSRFPSISPPWPGSLPRSGDSRSVECDQWENASVSFAALLEKCSELNRAADMLKERDQRTGINHHLISILRAIDALCHLCAAFIGEHPAPCPKESVDPALLALVIAANFKVLEVCALLVSISVSEVQRPHDQLLLKRIDFNLMQTKIALASMKEQEMTSPSVFQTALDQAARIHQQIILMTEC